MVGTRGAGVSSKPASECVNTTRDGLYPLTLRYVALWNYVFESPDTAGDRSVAVITASGLEQICYDADLSVLVQRPMV